MSGKRSATSPRENMSKKTSVQLSKAGSQMANKSHEADPNTIVKVEFDSINGKPFFGQVSDDELMYVWTQVFKRKREELFGITSSKTLTRNVRAIFKLISPIKVQEVIDGPLFKYSKILDDGSSEEICGKIIGYGAGKPAELGELVTVSIKTNFGVNPSGLADWMKLYGTIVTQKGFVTNKQTGLKTDTFEFEMVLRKHIEEYLPIFGQKTLINYPGRPRQCNRCYITGHIRRECKNKKLDWVEYIIRLIKEEGINIDLIGTWRNAIDRYENASSNPEQKS
jgi:hypothetical protein